MRDERARQFEGLFFLSHDILRARRPHGRSHVVAFEVGAGLDDDEGAL